MYANQQQTTRAANFIATVKQLATSPACCHTAGHAPVSTSTETALFLDTSAAPPA